MHIHPTAIVAPEARLAEDVTVGAYSIVGPKVSIGAGTEMGPHVVIEGRTTIGARNRIHAFAVLGCPPQDVGYRGEDTELIVGDDNVIRENASIHRGSHRGATVTRVGSGCFLMAYSHIAHDCRVGDHVIMANAATLGGHVQLEDHVNLGGLVAVHQFCRIGAFAFIGGSSAARMDIPPYMLADGFPAKLHGPNLVGLKRHGFAPEAIQAIKRSYRILFRSNLLIREAIEKTRQELGSVPEVEHLLGFLEMSQRGFTR